MAPKTRGLTCQLRTWEDMFKSAVDGEDDCWPTDSYANATAADMLGCSKTKTRHRNGAPGGSVGPRPGIKRA